LNVSGRRKYRHHDLPRCGFHVQPRAKGATHHEDYHPQTQGKIERWHQTLKNRILLEETTIYPLPGDLENQIGTFVDHYNNHRYRESLGNVTPAACTIDSKRHNIKPREAEPPLRKTINRPIYFGDGQPKDKQNY